MTDNLHLIVGPGALGRLLGLHLAKVAPIMLAGRRTLPAEQTLISPEGACCTRQLPLTMLSALPTLAPSYLHLTTKSYAASDAYETAMARLTNIPTLVLWQNGYQVQPQLDHRHPGPVLCASTTEGAWLSGDDGVVHAGRGITYIGALDQGTDSHALVALLNQAGLAAEAVADIHTRLWHKLAINAAINPLTARFRIRNGQLRDRPFRPMVEQVIAEVADILTSEGIEPPPTGWQTLVWQVIAGTAQNRSSMLQDVLADRPTEREAILGPLLEAAHRHGIAASQLATLDEFLAQQNWAQRNPA